MHREGHIGVALLVYAPVGVVTLALGFQELGFLGAVIAGGLAMLPDIDQRIPGVPHRGPTHTVWFALCVGVVFLAGGILAGRPQGILAAGALGAWAFTVGVTTVCSHILADSLTPAGVRPFTPYREVFYSFDIARASNPIANYVLLAIGVIAALAALALGNALSAI